MTLSQISHDLTSFTHNPPPPALCRPSASAAVSAPAGPEVLSACRPAFPGGSPVLKGFQHRHPKKIKRKMFVFCPSFLKGLYKLPLPKKNVRLNVRHCQALFEPLDPWNNRRAREIPGNLKKIKTKKKQNKTNTWQALTPWCFCCLQPRLNPHIRWVWVQIGYQKNWRVAAFWYQEWPKSAIPCVLSFDPGKFAPSEAETRMAEFSWDIVREMLFQLSWFASTSAQSKPELVSEIGSRWCRWCWLGKWHTLITFET